LGTSLGTGLGTSRNEKKARFKFKMGHQCPSEFFEKKPTCWGPVKMPVGWDLKQQMCTGGQLPVNPICQLKCEVCLKKNKI